MDAESSHSDQALRLMAWLEVNWRRAAGMLAAIIVVGVVVAFFVWSGNEKERKASGALSSLLITTNAVPSAQLLAFAREQEGSGAAVRATLLAATALFNENRYQEAQAQFEAFLGMAPPDSLIPEARYGIASCKEAQGLVEAAIVDYQAIVENPASGNVVPQARFELGRLYQDQGKLDLARTQFELLARDRGSSLAAEAVMRLQTLPRPEPVAPLSPTTPIIKIPSAAPASNATPSTSQP